MFAYLAPSSVQQDTNLEQELVLHDPLDGLDEQVCDRQSVAKPLFQVLRDRR